MESRKHPEALQDAQLDQVTGGQAQLFELFDPDGKELQDLVQSGNIDLELQTGRIEPRSGT